MRLSGTDKFHRHAYERYYEVLLEPYRHKPGVMLLEIGADSGASLKLWSDYFENPQGIHAIAYGQGDNGQQKEIACAWSAKSCAKIKIFRGDQSNRQFLRQIARNRYDIIIDDGSHEPSHMIISFQELFSSLNPGGVYIIEDLETNYWNQPGASIYGYSLAHAAGIGASAKYSAVEKLKQLVDVLNRFHMAVPELSVIRGDENIFSITFGQNLAIIHKNNDVQASHLPSVSSAPVVRDTIVQWMKESQSTNPDYQKPLVTQWI
jgi:PAS domain-containing protein